MKNLIILCISMMITYFASAQIVKQNHFELGVRVGNWAGSGASIDGVYNLPQKRIHADLGLFQNAVVLEAFYDWDYPITDKFSFYPGPGASISISEEGFTVAVGFELGFEYDFELPLSIGLDWRPLILLFRGFGYNHIGLNIRYRF